MKKTDTIINLIEQAQITDNTEVKRTILNTALDNLQNFYNSLSNIKLISPINVIDNYISRLQSGNFESVEDSLINEVNSINSKSFINKIKYNRKDDWFYYGGTSVLCSKDVIVLLDEFKSIVDIIEPEREKDFILINDIKSFISEVASQDKVDEIFMIVSSKILTSLLLKLDELEMI